MDHIAIMKKSWNFLPKILKGEKKIESRWYLHKRKPWGAVKSGEDVYFKNSGGAVTIKAKIDKVLQFDNLTPLKIKELFKKYGKGIGLTPEDIPYFIKQFKDKKYCLLIFLKNPTPVLPFQVNKKGFGNMAAWITTDNINKIKNDR